VADLVLETRVAVARQNLTRLVNVQAMVERRDERVAAFLELPDQLRSQVHALHKIVLDLIGLELPLDVPADLPTGLADLESGLRDARADLALKAQEVKRVRKEFTELTRDRQDVDDFLIKAAAELGRNLTTANYWKKRRSCEALFSEYVDYLRGVAIRSTGFGDDSGTLSDLFLLADNLPALWGRPGGRTWKSLAVPSRVEQNASTKAYVLRIGFPEWTIWALPLLQHEFGHVVIKKNPDELPVGSRTEAAMLADALAGLVTGPADGCAELLLRLDPAAVGRSTSDIGPRSATILETLRRSAEVANDPALSGLAERLKLEWLDAVESAGGDPSELDTAMASAAVTSVIERAAQFLNLGDWSGEEQPQAPVWASRWATVVGWSELLAKDRSKEIQIGEAEGPNGELPIALALLLDAAWLARVGSSAQDDAPKEIVDQLATAATECMLDVVRATRSESQGSGTGKTAKE
jgi:hypothetical protein